MGPELLFGTSAGAITSPPPSFGFVSQEIRPMAAVTKAVKIKPLRIVMEQILAGFSGMSLKNLQK
jgi:hypothetical protein